MWKDSRGVAAIEFAFVAPVLVLMLLGTIEVGRAINVHRHFTMATATVSDLVAREEWMGTTGTDAQNNLDSMMKSIEQIMSPYDTKNMQLRVLSVQASSEDANDTKVQWSYSYNGMQVPSNCSSYTLPSGLIDKGESVIVVESKYLYKPLFAGAVPAFASDLTWTDTSIHSPRNSCVDYIKPAGNACISSC